MRADREADDLAELLLLCAYEGGVLMSEVRGNTRPLRLPWTRPCTSCCTDLGAAA